MNDKIENHGREMASMYYRAVANMGECKYLISAGSHRIAEGAARELGLQLKQWKYIPQDGSREMKIRGIHGISAENLIGYFSNEERAYLTR